ncbi:MAG: hypothetical protein LBM38_01830 [Clostridiales bacterium]|nr:hypothetical protein [Clostridiales bacterium]
MKLISNEAIESFLSECKNWDDITKLDFGRQNCITLFEVMGEKFSNSSNLARGEAAFKQFCYGVLGMAAGDAGYNRYKTDVGDICHAAAKCLLQMGAVEPKVFTYLLPEDIFEQYKKGDYNRKLELIENFSELKSDEASRQEFFELIVKDNVKGSTAEKLKSSKKVDVYEKGKQITDERLQLGLIKLLNQDKIDVPKKSLIKHYVTGFKDIRNTNEAVRLGIEPAVDIILQRDIQDSLILDSDARDSFITIRVCNKLGVIGSYLNIKQAKAFGFAIVSDGRGIKAIKLDGLSPEYLKALLLEEIKSAKDSKFTRDFIIELLKKKSASALEEVFNCEMVNDDIKWEIASSLSKEDAFVKLALQEGNGARAKMAFSLLKEEKNILWVVLKSDNAEIINSGIETLSNKPNVRDALKAIQKSADSPYARNVAMLYLKTLEHPMEKAKEVNKYKGRNIA